MRGTDYCDIQSVTLTDTTAATAERSFVEMAGLNGGSKCTHQVVVAADKGAPGIAMDSTSQVWAKF